MGILDDQILDDAKLAFIDADGFAESIVYIKAVSGERRTINAVVQRHAPEQQLGTPYDAQPRMLIWVANDATTGIASSELNTGGDKVEFPYRLGQLPSVLAIKQAKGPAHDSGMMMLEV